MTSHALLVDVYVDFHKIFKLVPVELMDKIVSASRLNGSFGRLISMVMQAFTGIQEPICQPVVSYPYFSGCLLFLSSPKWFKMSTKELVDSKVV